MLDAEEMRGKTSEEAPHPAAWGEIMRAAIRAVQGRVERELEDNSNGGGRGQLAHPPTRRGTREHREGRGKRRKGSSQRVRPLC